MNRYKTFLFLCVAMAVIAVRANPQVGILPKNDVALKETTDEKFRVGDVWEYQTRKGEKHSRITILRLDESPELGTIVHIGVDKVRLSNCHGGPEPDAVPHMPFARNALKGSVIKKVATDQPLPDYEEGYREWRAAYEQKHAGIYVVSVAEAVSVAEKTFQRGNGCK